MRHILTILFVGLLWFALPAKSQAQYYYPGYYAPPIYGSAAYIGPYGYRGFYNFNAYPTPFGYNSLYNFGTWQQPYASGPFHSVYFNPYLNTYQYGTGYLNTPVFSYFYGY